MTHTLDTVNKDQQTAYMENKTISDNLRLINLSLREVELICQPIYALDAKKHLIRFAMVLYIKF